MSGQKSLHPEANRRLSDQSIRALRLSDILRAPSTPEAASSQLRRTLFEERRRTRQERREHLAAVLAAAIEIIRDESDLFEDSHDEAGKRQEQ